MRPIEMEIQNPAIVREALHLGAERLLSEAVDWHRSGDPNRAQQLLSYIEEILNVAEVLRESENGTKLVAVVEEWQPLPREERVKLDVAAAFRRELESGEEA